MQNLVKEIKIVTFRLGDIEFGLPIEQIQSIERMSLLTGLPKAPSYVRGIVDFRNSVMPVLDLVQLLLHKDLVESDLTRIITVVHHDHLIGFLVDAATDVMDIPSSSVQQPNLLIEYDSPYLTGIANLPNRLIVLIDIHKLLGVLSTDTFFNLKNLQLMEFT